jgi:hypothetical protein
MGVKNIPRKQVITVAWTIHIGREVLTEFSTLESPMALSNSAVRIVTIPASPNRIAAILCRCLLLMSRPILTACIGFSIRKLSTEGKNKALKGGSLSFHKDKSNQVIKKNAKTYIPTAQ